MISKLTEIGGRPRAGEGVVVEDYVAIGKNAVLGHHAVIRTGTIVGDDVRIDEFACIGKPPMREEPAGKRGRFGRPREADPMSASTGDPGNRCILGSRVRIGTGAVLYRGAHVGDGCEIGDGACVCEGVEIGAGAAIGRRAILEPGARIPENGKVAAGAVVGPESRNPEKTD